MSCFLEAHPDVFQLDSSIPPPYLKPENHCNKRNLSNMVEQSSGVGVSFEIIDQVEQVAQPEAYPPHLL